MNKPNKRVLWRTGFLYKLKRNKNFCASLTFDPFFWRWREFLANANDANSRGKWKQIWLQFIILILKLLSQTKKTTSIFNWVGFSMTWLVDGQSLNIEQFMYQDVLFWLIHHDRRHCKYLKLTKMVENVDLVINWHIKSVI